MTQRIIGDRMLFCEHKHLRIFAILLCAQLIACGDDDIADASIERDAEQRDSDRDVDVKLLDASIQDSDLSDAPVDTFDSEPDSTVDAPINDPMVNERLYPDWCLAGIATPRDIDNVVATVAVGESIQNAINQANNGVVELAPGVHRIEQTITLKSGVVLRGATQASTIETTRAMDSMVSIGGGYTGSQNITLTEAKAFARQMSVSSDITPGFWLIGDTNVGQLVHVLSVSGRTATLEAALTQNFDGFTVNSQNDLITRTGLERLTLEPKHTVNDLVFIRSATDCWVHNVTTKGVEGQVRAAIYTRQAYRVSITNNTVIDAAEHGDGGQGYGIDIANNSSNCLVENNNLRRLRHSMLMQTGAAGNVFRGNDSAEPLHPNFVPGGPADISFHGYSSGNLAVGNMVDRIHIVDSGSPGPHNTIAFNTLRSGPLTLQAGVNYLTLLGNVMTGDVTTLRNRIMPSIMTESTAGNPSPERAFWENNYDPFEGPAGNSGFTERGIGILDLGSGDDVYIDEQIQAAEINLCGN